MSLLSPFRTLRRGEYSVIEEHPSPQPPHGPPISSQPDNESSPAPKSNHISFPQHYAQMAQDIRPSLPSDHPWLDPGDVTFISVLPIGAGGFANIYEATHSSRKVVLKSYRCYMSFDVAQVVAVNCDRSLCRAHPSQLHFRGFETKFRYGPSFITEAPTWYLS